MYLTAHQYWDTEINYFNYFWIEHKFYLTKIRLRKILEMDHKVKKKNIYLCIVSCNHSMQEKIWKYKELKSSEL